MSVIGRARRRGRGNNYGKGSNKGHISENGNDPGHEAGSDDEKEAPFKGDTRREPNEKNDTEE